MKTRPISNPPNPWRSGHAEYIEAPPGAELQVFEEQATDILAENSSPDLGFRFSLNPYRGCYHGCAYCYARPTHAWLDFGAGTDFERKIVVKANAPERLRAAFMKPAWQGEMIAFSGNTDCYQPLEACYGLTRRCLEVCHEFRNPVSIITKASLIRRDVDVLQALHRDARLHITLSLPFIDEEMARRIEPWVPSPVARLRTLRHLADAGLPVGVAVAPLIPGLNDSQVPDILTAARQAGAQWAFRTLLRLPQETRVVFQERLRQEYPERHDKVMNGIRAARAGAVYDSRFGRRMSGSGHRWAAVDWLFEVTCRRLGLLTARSREAGLASQVVVRDARILDTAGPSPFQRPGAQYDLFGTEHP